MLKTKVFYVIELEGERFYRRNHESVGGVRPTNSIIKAMQYSDVNEAKERYAKLLQLHNEDNKSPKPVNILRFGLLNANIIKEDI